MSSYSRNELFALLGVYTNVSHRQFWWGASKDIEWNQIRIWYLFTSSILSLFEFSLQTPVKTSLLRRSLNFGASLSVAFESVCRKPFYLHLSIISKLQVQDGHKHSHSLSVMTHLSYPLSLAHFRKKHWENEEEKIECMNSRIASTIPFALWFSSLNDSWSMNVSPNYLHPF